MIYGELHNMKKLLYFILGLIVAIPVGTWAINITVPQSTTAGDIPYGLSSGNYTPKAFSWLWVQQMAGTTTDALTQFRQTQPAAQEGHLSTSFL